jgi:hypothetical protein
MHILMACCAFAQGRTRAQERAAAPLRVFALSAAFRSRTPHIYVCCIGFANLEEGDALDSSTALSRNDLICVGLKPNCEP